MSFTRTLLLYLLVRLLVLGELLLPDGQYISGDLGIFAGWSRQIAAGTIPATDAWQYPPGFALVLWIIGSLGMGVGALLTLVLAADLGVLILLRRTAGARFWAVMPLLTGPMVLTRTDVILAFLAVAGLGARGWPARSGVLLGLGASLKLWPGMVVGALPRRDGMTRAVGVVITYVAVAGLAWAVIGPTGFLSNQGTRGLQVESLAAWPFMVARALGFDVPIEFRSGANEIALPAADVVAWCLVPISLAIVAALTLHAWREGRPDAAVDVARRAALIVSVLLLTSRVLSPQFNVWLLGMMALVVAAQGWFTRGQAAALISTCIAAQVLYPFAYDNFLGGGWLGLLVQTIRLAGLLGVAAVIWGQVRQPVAADAAPIPTVREAGG